MPDVAGAAGDSRLRWVLGAVVLGAVVVIGLAVLIWPSGGEPAESGSGAGAAENAVQETAEVTISGEDLPAPSPDTPPGLVAVEDDPAVGLEPPKLVGESFDGSEVVIDPSDGRPKMVVFGAHWCPHCQKEVPLIQEWIEAGSLPEGVDVYLVSSAVDEAAVNYPPSNWITEVDWNPPVLLDDTASGPHKPGSAAISYGLPGWPYFVLLGADGKVVQRGSGEIPVEDIDRLVGELAKGT